MGNETATATSSDRSWIRWLDTAAAACITTGRFSAPLDYADPAGRQIDICIVRDRGARGVSISNDVVNR